MMKNMVIYLLAVNFITFLLYGEDKSRARRHAWRIPEKVLMGAAVIGGSIGALLGMSIFHHNCAEDVVGDEFIKRWGKKMNVVVSGKCWVDCANKGANKGSALRHFQEEYGITPDETLAFGDNLNDIEMLKRASLCFAVENARDEVKEAANFVAPSYKEDGVLQVLKAVLSGELC